MNECYHLSVDLFHLSLNHNPPGCRNADTPHVHKHHELLFCTGGEGGQWNGQRELPLRPGDVYFYPAGATHCSVFVPGRTFDCYVLAFQSQMFTPALAADKEALDVVDKMSRCRGRVPFSLASGETVRRILEELLVEFQRKEAAYHAALKMMTMRLLIAIARDGDFHRQGLRICPPPSRDDMIQEVLHYLDAFYMNCITVDSLLEFCPLSRSHFHAVFKKATGKTLLEYLKDLRLEKAKEQLLTTEATVAEVASQSGFKTSSYFGQIFREATGISPGDFRKNHRVRKRRCAT